MKQTAGRLRVFFICSALVLATIIAFEPVRHNDFISYDDYAYVAENEQVRGGITRESVIWAFTTSHKANWHPLTWLSHMLDCELFELNPVWHHLVNLLFHIANALLLFWVFKRMTGKVWLSGFVAAVFALHPLNVEPVVWVAERKTVVSGLFWMLTIAAYVRYSERPSIARYLLAIFVYGLTIMTKPTVVTLPFVLLLLDFWPLQRLEFLHNNKSKDSTQPESAEPRFRVSSTWRLVTEKIPLFALAAILGTITFLVQKSGGAMLPAERLTLSYRIGNALVSYVSYISKMVYPSRLAIFYPHPGTSLPPWQPIACLVVLAIASAGIIYRIRQHRYLAVGWLWYLGTLVPVIGVIQAGSQAMADRYTYLPSIGISIMAAWGAVELLSKLRYRSIWLGILAGLLLTAMVVRTRMQVQHWKNNLTLYRYTLAVTENNAIIRNSYGCAFFEEEQPDEAIKQLKEALRISPRFSLARSNLGRIYLKQGKVNEAIACFNEVLRVGKDSPDVYYFLGLAEVRQEKYDDAVTHFTDALRLKQGHINARLQLAYTLVKLDRVRQAVEHFYKILQLKPDHLTALNGVAWVLATRNDIETQEPIKAVEFAERACELTNYQNAGAMDTLAAAYAAAGKFSLAIETAEKAVELAISQNNIELTQEIQNRLRLYKVKQPYYEK